MSTKHLLKPLFRFQGLHFTYFKPRHGFTIIELLVVVAIIAIIAGFGFVSITRAQRNARDARRANDLNQIKIALEQYFDDNLYYPASTGGDLNCNPPGRVSSWNGTWDFKCNNTVYMRVLPRDPGVVTWPNYCYIADPSSDTESSWFKLYVLMENEGNANIPQVSIPTCPNLSDKNYVLESER